MAKNHLALPLAPAMLTLGPLADPRWLFDAQWLLGSMLALRLLFDCLREGQRIGLRLVAGRVRDGLIGARRGRDAFGHLLSLSFLSILFIVVSPEFGGQLATADRALRTCSRTGLLHGRHGATGANFYEFGGVIWYNILKLDVYYAYN